MEKKDLEEVKKQIEGLIKDAKRTIEINEIFLKAIEWKIKN